MTTEEMQKRVDKIQNEIDALLKKVSNLNDERFRLIWKLRDQGIY